MKKAPERKNIFEAFYNKLSKPFTSLFLYINFTPNQITSISGIFGILGALLLTMGDYSTNIIAAIFIQIFAILDVVDGDVARAKDLQSVRGMWLDIFFDKLNDFLIISCFTLGVFLKNTNPIILFFGMCLMGINFFIQFIMVLNDHLFKVNRVVNEDIINSKGDSLSRINYLVGNIVIFYRAHISLQHSQLLVLISFFAIINKMEFGLYFLSLHGLISLVISIIINFIKIRN